MGVLDNMARINEYNSMLYIKQPNEEIVIVEHGLPTVSYVPDGTVVAFRVIDPEDMDREEDTLEEKAIKLMIRIAKLNIVVQAKDFVDIDDYKNIILEERK